MDWIIEMHSNGFFAAIAFVAGIFSIMCSFHEDESFARGAAIVTWILVAYIVFSLVTTIY